MNINKETAKKLYSESPGWFREQLEAEFGADYLDPNYWENIKTLDDACAKLKIDFSELINEYDTPDERAYKMLKIIIRAINTDRSGK
ncbi:MAG TPA: hypothetical protein PKI17_04055, partial [Syntrophomonas sp.]|nr:hypothetical protein [Syntrophomonas sp.]